VRRSVLAGIAVLAAMTVVAPASAATPARADATVLFNAGTDALNRGDLGPAVAFLSAASRIDPRARDVRTNLAIARARAEDAQGSEEHAGTHPPPPFALSPGELWRLSAVLALAGALLAWLAAIRPGSRRILLVSTAVFAAGLVIAGAQSLRSREEARHPEAVVVAPVLEVGAAPDERPAPPYLLGAGDEVRVGRVRGDLAEIRVSGNSIGWARRSGLWRVADAPRYTAQSEPR
jgi:hypothetical protein